MHLFVCGACVYLEIWIRRERGRFSQAGGVCAVSVGAECGKSERTS